MRVTLTATHWNANSSLEINTCQPDTNSASPIFIETCEEQLRGTSESILTDATWNQSVADLKGLVQIFKNPRDSHMSLINGDM